MSRGDFPSAWDISARHLAEDPPRRDCSLPYHLRSVWRGQAFDGRHVLVRCFHGLGDTIQFARYLPALRERARSVTVEMQAHLLPLFGDFPGVDALIPFDPASPAPEGPCDIEIMELQFALRRLPQDLATYLSAEPAELPAGTVGLCWLAGDWNPGRSIPEEAMAPLAAGPAVTLVTAPTALPVLNPEGCPLDIIATAALVAGAELVITVDTMIAHLAGAMGKPTWLLVKQDCDWRWAHEGERSLWYPSMRLYRQQRPGDWAAVIARVAADLTQWRATGTAERIAPTPTAPLSWGELIDKVTILEIKSARLTDEAALANVRAELALLADIVRPALERDGVRALTARLRAINAELWDIEDRIRLHEQAGSFGSEFVALARSVYRTNDERAAVKRKINERLGSALVEEKSYARFPGGRGDEPGFHRSEPGDGATSPSLV